jgi:hypothetical protein
MQLRDRRATSHDTRPRGRPAARRARARSARGWSFGASRCGAPAAPGVCTGAPQVDGIARASSDSTRPLPGTFTGVTNMPTDKKLDTRIDETIDDLADRVKLATDKLTERAHQLAESAKGDARLLARKASDKLHDASEKLREAAAKLERASR